MSRIVLGYHEQAAGVFVYAMDDAGAADPSLLVPGTDCMLFLRKHGDTLWVSAAFQVSDKRMRSLSPGLSSDFAQRATGRRVDDFVVDLMTEVYLQETLAATN
mgnify:CR=1 FL=1